MRAGKGLKSSPEEEFFHGRRPAELDQLAFPEGREHRLDPFDVRLGEHFRGQLARGDERRLGGVRPLTDGRRGG